MATGRITNRKAIIQNRVPQIAFPNRKAITPIIAIILTMMMVVAVAGAMFYWISRIQGQGQGGVESFSGRFFTTAASAVNVIHVSYNGSFANAELLTMFLQNIGNSNIPLDNGTSSPTTEWIVLDVNGRPVCSSSWGGTIGTNATIKCMRGCATDILPGQIRQVVLNLSIGECTLMNITNGTQVKFTIDFSGKTTTTGTFIKTVPQ
ncbi:MAG: hypothetical protein HY438_00540 [DPANN group archaeon]|nr:hypothetical protein [DPANN group archaeon]